MRLRRTTFALDQASIVGILFHMQLFRQQLTNQIFLVACMNILSIQLVRQL